MMTRPGPRGEPTTVREEIDRIHARLDRMETDVDRVVAKMNMAIGGIGALSVVALINLVTDLVSAASKVGVQ